MAVKRVGTRTPQRKVTRGMSSALFDTMSQGVVYQDTEGGITAANPSAERILGLTLDQMTGRTSMDPRWRAIRENGSDFPGNEHPAMVALRTGKQVNDVMMGVFHPKEGEYRWILVNAVPEFDSGKKRPLRVLVTFTDVTDRKRAEEALRASEDKFSKAFRVSPDSININRMSDGLFLEANEGFTTLTGYTKEDVLGRTSLEINIWAHSEDRQRLMNGLQKDGEVANLEASFRSKDGSTRTGLMSARIINVNGEQCILSITRDITERKQVEWALRHSEERYRNLVENISEIFFIVDHRGKIVYGSPNLFSSTGYEEGELIGKSYVGLVAREDRLRIMEFYEQRTLDGTIDCRCEFLARMKTGRSVWVEQVTRIIRNEAGSVVQYWNVVRDITERKQIEEALHKSEEKYRALIETTDTGYVIIDDEGKVLDANQEYVRLTGRKNLVDILNHSVLEWTAGSDRTRNAEAVRQCMAQGFIRDFEIEYIHDDGTRVPIQIDATVMKTGSRTNILTLCRDITEHRQAEEMRRESNARVHAIVDGAPFGAHSYELHSDGRLIFSGGNRSADRVLGMDHSLLIGKTIEEAFPPLATTSVPNAYRHVAVTGERYEADQVDYEDDRIRGAFEIHAFQTGINRMTVFFRDITERKRAELALKESEGRLRTIIETEPECVKVVDRDGRVLEMNAAGLAMLEADTLGEVQQRVLLEFILPEHRAAFRALHERVMNGEGGTLEFEAMGLKGTRRWLETHAAPMRSATGEITRLLGVSRDITERKRAEEAMREKEHLLSESQRIAHIGSWKFEMNGTNLWTDETYRIYGVSPDSFIPTAESFFALIHPDDRNVMRDWIEKCASGNNPGEFDFRTILPDGTIRCLSGQGELICDGEKKPLYMTG
ncbi:MAG TPA: hypothetical protein DGH68_01045, partial [Bacteroidetes bacterium]|nr:hypothetical protein [Bacteroidota bacterium]